MWSDILRTLFGPSKVPHKIQKLLQYRFVFAFILGFLLDYMMLAIFVFFQFFEGRRPLKSLTVILQWTMFSLYASAMMILTRVGMAAYGVVLCHVHYAYPRCNGSKMKRIIYEFPIHFSLLFSILSVAISTSWLYSSFVDPVEGYYNLILGCVSGIFYFKTQHGLTLQRFPLPIVRLGLQESILQNLWPLKISLREALKPTILFSMIFWPYMENIFNGFKVIITEPGILFRGCLVNILILAKLHMVRELYSVIMQCQLPLSIDLRCRDTRKDICLQNLFEEWIKRLICSMKKQALEEEPRYSLSLPISNALDSTHLYGFRMLAARDFYAEMTGSLWTKLFAIEDMKNTSAYWEELRGVLHKIIKDFLDQMDSCLDTAPQAQICYLLKRQTGIRSLIKPKTKRPPRTCCCQPIYQEQPTQIFCCCKEKPTYSIIFNVRDSIREGFPSISGYIFQSFPALPNLYASLFEIDKLAKLNHVLQCGEPLVWILQGLVCICARSLKEDSFGIVQRDLSWVFEVLLNVEVKLIAAAGVPAQTDRGNENLCPSHKLLMLATNRCLFRMLKTFGPNLNFIVNNQTLLEELKRKMENLNVFQEIL